MTKLSRFSQFGEKRLTAICVHSIWQSRTPLSRVLLEKLTGSQLVKKYLAFFVTRRFIAAFTGAAICPYPVADQSSPYPPSHFKIHFNIIPIYACVFQMVSFPRVSPPEACMLLSSPPYMLQTPPISFLIWSPK
jgi:hypothetical protein